MTMFNQAGRTGTNPTDLSETVPYYQTRDEEQGMGFVDVFMVDSDKSVGSWKAAGNVYSVRQYEADSLAEKGVATVVEVAPLKLTQGKMDNLTKQLQEAADKIKENDRLSPIGKREEIQLLVGQYEDAAEALQNQYTNELGILKQAELSKSQQFKSNSKIDAHEARTQAGLLKAAVSVAPTLDGAAQAVKDKLPGLDISVARELLSQFTDIKRELEAKPKRQNDVQASAAVGRVARELYGALEAASTTPDQAAASTKYKMLDAIESQRGDIRTDFKSTTRALLRMY